MSPTQTFALWHRDNPVFLDNIQRTLLEFPHGFTCVAYVETNHVGAVFALTNHIDSDWTTNPEVTLVVKGGLRSTSVGDVIVADNGADYNDPKPLVPNVRYTIDGIGLRTF